MEFAKKLEQIEVRFEEISRQMADPEIISDGERYRKIAKTHSDLSEIVAKYREWKRVDGDLGHLQVDTESRDPGPEAGLEGLGIETVEDAFEGVMRGNTVGQGQEAVQPGAPALTEGGDLLPVISATEDGTDGDDDDVEQEVQAAVSPARVFE